MRILTEIAATVMVAFLVLLLFGGLDSLPTYMMEYLLRSGLVYQGY